MSAREYDLIVIGAGAVGENVADRAAQGGLRVVIVEAELVGGECSYWACMPSKALLRAGAAMRAAQGVAGVTVSGELDARAVLARRDRIVHEWNDSSQTEWLASAGIDLVRGHGRLSGERMVTVTTDSGELELRARHAVAIATGSSARLPDIPGLKGADAWTSREATSAHEIPPRLAILGGGVVACELATAYLDLGSAVTLVARSGLLAGQEPFAAEAVAAALRERGAVLHLEATTTSVTRRDGLVKLRLDDGTRLEADELLVATGREPRTGELGLETAGLTPGEWIEVDDTLRVRGVDWLYAVGDVTGRALLTHQGKYQARAAGDAIAARARGEAVDDSAWGRHVATADGRAVPQVTFTDPEIASVGLTAAGAEKAGLRTRVLDYDLAQLAGATTHADHYRGRARAIVDDERGVLVGASFVGPGVAELLHAATIAIVGEVPLDRLWHAVPSYPTLSEVWLRLLESDGR